MRYPASRPAYEFILRDPRVFELTVEGGPILTTETNTLNFGDLWDIELTFNEQHDAAGDILEIEYSIQHLTANHPGVPPVGPVMTGSLEIDASRRFRPQPGTLTVAGEDNSVGHGFLRADFARFRLLGFSPSRESFDFDSWRFTISGADVRGTVLAFTQPRWRDPAVLRSALQSTVVLMS